MKGTVRVTLQPLGTSIEIPRGTPLQDALFPFGVEFPCGGKGRCRGCRIKIIEGPLPPPADHASTLSAQQLEAGWRLACRCQADADLTIELAQWEASILSDDESFACTPRQGLGIAIDLGTTTLVAQLLDLSSANVLGVRTALNHQARHGADIMSRIGFAVNEHQHAVLTSMIRDQLGTMIRELCATAGADPGGIVDVVLVGNTVMHHLFCGIDCTPLSRFPFEPTDDGTVNFAPSTLGWRLGDHTTVRFLPCLGGFVGSDILAGIIATNLHASPVPLCLIDLGTNGEIVVGWRDRLLCCSTAAGPAFEGARIMMGMRASTGAIAEVRVESDRLLCKVLGDGNPRGICGSGLVDAVAVLLDNGTILPGGRFADKASSVLLMDPVRLSQTDIRELQLAKGAVAAGVRILLQRAGLQTGDVEKVFVAGAFGNYVSTTSARRIGLLAFPPDKIFPAGNTALRGAKRELFEPPEDCLRLAERVEHVSLHAQQDFQDIYVEEMTFPSESV
jgi:uncharacterized 2Fe-2S/4Fe-4S cluster protein (DUF4445 family)